MKIKHNLLKLALIIILMPSMMFLTNCKGGSDGKTDGTIDSTTIATKSNSKILLEEIVKNGDLINSKKVPTMITADKVNEAAEGTIKVIDLRNGKDFSEGHIKGAENIKLSELLDYIKSIDVASFEKIVMVCYTGQTASYATSALQMMGYTNVYAMKWGMSSWNKKFSEKWLTNAKSDLAEKLSVEAGTKGEKGTLPDFECKKTNGEEILDARVSKLFSDGFKKGTISIDDIIASPGDYYIVNYWGAKLYNIGHLEGAVQYTPKASLGLDTELLTLPTDKTIVVYCFTGQHAAFVTAYLRILGYDAKVLKYGANSFMNSMMLDETIGHGFSDKQTFDFDTETSEYVEEGGVQEGGC